VYGSARPGNGRTSCVLLPRVNADRVADALAGFAAHPDPGGTEVLVDDAGWHAAERLVIPGSWCSTSGPVYPRTPTGRAVLGTRPGVGGERHVRPAG